VTRCALVRGLFGDFITELERTSGWRCFEGLGGGVRNAIGTFLDICELRYSGQGGGILDASASGDKVRYMGNPRRIHKTSTFFARVQLFIRGMQSTSTYARSVRVHATSGRVGSGRQ
jgi:hypothetical protein